MARFKVPKQVIFGSLPMTSTGKIQKFVLRDQLRSASAIE
jgi:fatty-acyl-CoA synthase